VATAVVVATLTIDAEMFIHIAPFDHLVSQKHFFAALL
jgi:hypothetical protein